MLKEYTLYMKSHSPAPDFEATILASSKEEAGKLFINRHSIDLNVEDIIKDIASEDEL